MWCGKQTKEDRKIEGVEHIFPKGIGGRKTLRAGSVCKKCNFELRGLDESLKKEHPAMMIAFQIDPQIKGYVRDKEDKIRKQRERILIKGIGESKYTRISREHLPDVNLVNADFIIKSQNFIRALHKCTANILCNHHDSIFMRKNYPDLLQFVYNGGDVAPWSYAVSFSNPFDTLLVSEPKYFLFNSIQEEIKKIVGFLHTSGIWITGSHPFLLNQNNIKEISELIMNGFSIIEVPEKQRSIVQNFGFNYDLSKERVPIGDLKFLWIT